MALCATLSTTVQVSGRGSLPHSRWTDVCFQQDVVNVSDACESSKATKNTHLAQHRVFSYVPLRTLQRWKHYDVFGESPAVTRQALGKTTKTT